MAEQNKTRPTAADPRELIASLPDDQQREDSRALLALMQEVSGEPAVLWFPSIIGFGSVHYRYASGREGDMPGIAFAPRKGTLALYIVDDAAAHAEVLERMGRHRIGKSCIYLRRLEDADPAVLRELVELGWRLSATMKHADS